MPVNATMMFIKVYCHCDVWQHAPGKVAVFAWTGLSFHLAKRGEPMPESSAITPLEVQLVEDVRSCRSCQWFWGGIPPYGPYPAYDWQSPFPERFQQSDPWDRGRTTAPLMTVVTNGSQCVDPAIMHGCRKAPIMTMGINPNLTSYFQGTTGARWAYPHFSDSANYAYYYRFQTLYQESFNLDFLREHLLPESAIKAEDDGWLINVVRGRDHRWMELEILYQQEDKSRTIEVAWTDEARYIVVAEECQPHKDPYSFHKGDTITAKLVMPTGVETQLYENTTGYYQRFIPILQYLSDHINVTRETTASGGPSTQVRLRLGEDVAQHDMVSCASPGWSESYDIPCDTIMKKCVSDKGFAIAQLLQSRPSVLVLVGRSSLEMFGTYFGRFMDLDYDDKDIYQLLKETCKRRKYLTIDIGGYTLRTRLIACPHFSYYENYYRQSRFSAEAWHAFTKDFPDDYEILKKEAKVKENGYNGVTALKINGSEDRIQNHLSVAAWSVIMAYYLDPNRMIAAALIEEYSDGALALDEGTLRLQRAAGSCCYCDNSVWRFPDGCTFGKKEETVAEPGQLEDVVRQVLADEG